MDENNPFHDFAPIPVRAALDKELGAALRVLVLIAAHVGKDGTCFPSQGKIAAALGVSRQAVIRHINKLEQNGYIKRESRTRDNGSATTCLYRVLYALPCNTDITPAVTPTLQPLSHPDVTPPVTSGSYTHNKPINKPNEYRGKSSKFSLPDWINLDDWNGFEELRRTKKKPLTDRARVMHVKKLQELQAQGYDPAAVIQQSIMKAWDSFYEIKGQDSGIHHTLRQQEQEDSQRLMNDLMGGQS